MPKAKSKSQQTQVRSEKRRRARLARPVQHRGLDQLRGRFEAFRDANPPTARIPDSLRKAVLSLLQEGVTRSAVERTCGVSWTQMNQWNELYRPQELSRRAPSSRAARVLSVVDEAPSTVEPLGAPEPSMEPLELRLGHWWITVRPTGMAQ